MHNMLSSQPMCFNLFGPLAVDRERAGRLLAALFPGEIARVHEVKIEYAPSPASEYLADRTSFDAFIDYERDTGEMSDPPSPRSASRGVVLPYGGPF